jgi:hypothetical protein
MMKCREQILSPCVTLSLYPTFLEKNGRSIGLNAFLLITQARFSKPLLSELRLQKI